MHSSVPAMLRSRSEPRSRQRRAAISIWTSWPWRSPPGSRRRLVGKPRRQSCWGSLTSGSQPSAMRMLIQRKTTFLQWVLLVGMTTKDVPREILVTNGTPNQIMSDLHDASSVIAVNITGIIARLRAKARTAGIDLSQPFFFPPDTRASPRSSPSSTRSARRESRVSGKAKRNYRRHQPLMNRQDIRAAPRLREAPVAAR